jgi:fibronectin type 3 domain-containing protein
MACGKKGNPVPKDLPVPGGISDLRADAKDGVLFLSFSIPTQNRDGSEIRDLQGFNIQRSCGSCGGALEPWKEIRLTDKQGYTIREGRMYLYDDKLQPGTQYGYRVLPVLRNNIEGDGSNIVLIKWQKTPEPPVTVKAEGENGAVTLSWNKSSDLLYNVYRFDNDIYPLFPLNAAPLNEPRYANVGLKNGMKYRYEVRAVKMGDTVLFEGSGTSVTAVPRDTTPPSAPSDIAAVKKSSTVTLSWTANPEVDLAGYNVYRTVSGKTEKLNSAPVVETHFTDLYRGVDTPYISYYITAVDTSGNEGSASRELIVILKE